jgi:hypothetical protein
MSAPPKWMMEPEFEINGFGFHDSEDDEDDKDCNHKNGFHNGVLYDGGNNIINTININSCDSCNYESTYEEYDDNDTHDDNNARDDNDAHDDYDDNDDYDDYDDNDDYDDYDDY